MERALSLLQSILSSPAGSFATVLSLFLLAFWLVHWLTKRVTQITASHERLREESMQTTHKVDAYAEKVEQKMNAHAEKVEHKVNVHSEKIDQRMDEIRRDIAYLKVTMDIYKSGSSHALAQSHSPVSLTELGIKLADELGTQKMIARNWDRILALLEQNVGKSNAYDVQQFCIETATVELEQFLDAQSIEVMKEYAFKNGRPLAYYAPLFAIPIRDKYLEIRGIAVSEIDRHAPKPM